MPSNYMRPGYPLLARLYGTCCDRELSEADRSKWAARNGQDQSYLDNYPGVSDVARQLYDEVGKNQPELVDGKKYYLPTRAQAEALIPSLIQELMRPPSGDVAGRTAAVKHAGRPVLSCLAEIILNQDPQFRSAPEAFLKEKYGFAVDSAPYTYLLEFAKSQQPALSLTQASRLIPFLVDDVIARPPVW